LKPASADTDAVRELIAFFALTFAIIFVLGIAEIFFRPQFEGIFGPLGSLLTSWPNAALIIGIAGPDLKGWRFSKRARANP
jgi:hypothetical protein